MEKDENMNSYIQNIHTNGQTCGLRRARWPDTTRRTEVAATARSSTENAVAALVQASPYTHATATPVNVVPARLQPTQQ